MFFILPITWIYVIYISAAIIPAILLLRYVYRMDTYEKEPGSLLMQLLGCGVLAALASIILEMLGQWLLDASPLTQNTKTYILVLAFLVVAAVEEGTKYFFLYKRTWNDPNFNYRFDGIVYAAFVSLGFAAFENVKYVFNYGLTVAFPRAILAIPGHLGFSVVFGYFYGRAKRAANRGSHGAAVANIVVGYLMAVFLHGFYDACAMSETAEASVAFIIFVIIMYFVIYRLIKRESWNDEPV